MNTAPAWPEPMLPKNGALLCIAQRAGDPELIPAANPIAGWELEIRLAPHLALTIPLPQEMAPAPAVFRSWDETKAVEAAAAAAKAITLRVHPILSGHAFYPPPPSSD